MRTAHAHTTATEVRDSDARALAMSALAGVISETDARWRIAALLQGSDIVEQIVRRLHVSPHQVDEVTSRIYDQAHVAIVTGVAGRPPKLSLDRLADGSSFCGWARQYLSSQQVATTARRPLWSRERRELLSGHESLDDAVDEGAVDEDHRLDDDVVETVIEHHKELAKGLRSCGSTHLAARTAIAVYQLPQPERLVDVPNRAALLAAFGAEVCLVRLIVRFLLDELPCPTATQVDDDTLVFELARVVSQMLSSWSDDEVRRLADLDPRISQAIALAALTPVPPPQARQVADLQLQLALDGASRRDARALAASFAALESELAVSEYDALHEPEVKTPEQRAADRARFEAIVAKILADGWTRFGGTPLEVEQHLRAMLDDTRYVAVAAA